MNSLNGCALTLIITWLCVQTLVGTD